MNYLLGYDIGSSSVKAALIDGNSGKLLASVFSPASEMAISSPRPGFAEQDPDRWWAELVHATALLRQAAGFSPQEVMAIGISYQMHGLVCVDRRQRPVRPAIIWCDSRAVSWGEKAFADLGEQFCLQHYLNSPGNFTASKLKWVMENEPRLYASIDRIMLPGDYIAMRLTGTACTTVPGLSEAILWDYPTQQPAYALMQYYGIDPSLLPPLVPSFGEQGRLLPDPAGLLGLKAGTPVTYRAGDQPNNAYSLQVLEPGEIAATAGTSGVVYGVTDRTDYDSASRVNSFVHVNHQTGRPRLGILLCLNGTGILYSWLRRQFFAGQSYEDLNREAAMVPTGSEGLLFYPFGNGAERILSNRDPGAALLGLQFNRHHRGHIARAAQEGIAFALNYGMEIMAGMGFSLARIRAGLANMFLSELFAAQLANISGCCIELCKTDGAQGAARAAGVGAGWFAGYRESFCGMEWARRIEPDPRQAGPTGLAYAHWKKHLNSFIT